MTATMNHLPQTNPITNAVAENPSKSSTDTDLSFRDVGLLFVHEYYTYLSNNPNDIHAFYSHDSIMVRGNDAEDPVTAQGGEAIRRCLEETPLESTRVRLDSVDSVQSANNGILVQVLGDMANSSIGVRRFSQTFFLATQPNGFYVLTDILRFLKEDQLTDEKTNQPHAQVKQDAPLPDTTTPVATSDPHIKSPSSFSLDTNAAAAAAAMPAVSNLDTESGRKDDEATAAAAALPVDEEKDEQDETDVATATEEKPKAPKTWSIVAAGSDTKRKSTSPPLPESPITESKSDSQNADSKPTSSKEQQQSSSPREAVPKEEQTDVFLKNVKNLTNEQIKEAFTAAVGEVKSVTIHNNRTTAFLTFTTPESCQKALEQRRVDVGEVTVLIEERRPATSRPPRPYHSGGGRGEPFGERRFGPNRRGGGASRGGKPRGGGGGGSGSGSAHK
ncbi:hypothetical protein BX666DRAFT_1962380 [Dichotomocladium elegans]|nr:hypothetical protein BX666DRAFT_1962380 [Dichotomocladium elegans]